MDRPPPPPPPASVLLATRQAPQPDLCPGCREIPEAIVDRYTRNRRRLKAFAAATDPLSRLRWRNLLVEDNLPLVYTIAGRQGAEAGLSFEDLAQVGSLGLIRAVEAFDPDRNVSLSSFAVPYMHGQTATPHPGTRLQQQPRRRLEPRSASHLTPIPSARQGLFSPLPLRCAARQTMESKKISPHQVRVFRHLQSHRGWLTNTDIAAACGVSYRTAAEHTKRLTTLGILQCQEVFPHFQFRYATDAPQRAGAYFQRLENAAVALQCAA